MNVKSKTSDLNNHLFAQLERLSDEDLSREEIETEIRRSDAICKISKEIISNNRLVVEAARVASDMLNANIQLPEYLGIGVVNE